VIDVVERHAVKLRHEFCPTDVRSTRATAARKARCSRSSNFLSAAHAASWSLPFRDARKIAPFQRKRAAFAAFDPASQRVFPVRGMQHHFQILWRPEPGRQAACRAATPLGIV